MSEHHHQILRPSAARLVESLRDTGYTYQAAFADIVDNSIAAEATKIHIDMQEGIMGNELDVSFYDNGLGMTESQLVDAMKYGSPRRPSPNSLGKFGMGLKTASTAFCRSLTIISRRDGNYSTRTWDLDYIAENDNWVLLNKDIHEFGDQISKFERLVADGNGTIVIWEKVDRLLKNSGTDFAKEAKSKIESEIADHLSATFGKFLIGIKNFDLDLPDRKDENRLKIVLNDKEIIGWEPFGRFLNCNKAAPKVISAEEQITIYHKGKQSDVALKGFVLPNLNDLSPEEKDSIQYDTEKQGFYIYRENRLIYGGGWPHNLYKIQEKRKLLRVQLDFTHELDDYFEIDIRKTKVSFPPKLRKDLRKCLTPWSNEANRRYRSGSINSLSEDEIDIPATIEHQNSSKAIARQFDYNNETEVITNDKNDNQIKIRNKFGETTINRAKLVAGTEIFVCTIEHIEGNLLWDIGLNDSGKLTVILNESHEFYRRYYRSLGVNEILVQAMDSFLWSMANAEFSSVSDIAKRNYEELRLVLSNCLNNLAKELPDVG